MFFTQYLTDFLNNNNKEQRQITNFNLKKVFEFNSSIMKNWTLLVFINFEVDIKTTK